MQNITLKDGYSGTHQATLHGDYGPDLGGGAIDALAQYQNRPVYITGDTFRGGRCSNGGALSSVQWDILNSEFTNNKAIGWGLTRPPAARPAAAAAAPSTSTVRTTTC